MKNVSRIIVMVVFALALAIPAQAAAGDVTVGQFLVEIAKVKNISAMDGASAAAALRAQGMTLPSLDLGKRLTEGDVAAIAQSAGINVTTTRPANPFTSGQVDQFLSSFASDLGRTKDPGTQNPMAPGFDPETKGKKKGHNKTRSEIP
jgi:hypothetical protein